MKKRYTRNYTDEFKRQSVNLYFERGRSYKRLGEELGVPEGTLAGWVLSKKYQGGQLSEQKMSTES